MTPAFIAQDTGPEGSSSRRLNSCCMLQLSRLHGSELVITTLVPIATGNREQIDSARRGDAGGCEMGIRERKRTGDRRDEDLLGGGRLAGTVLAALLVVAGRQLLDVLLVLLRPEGRRRPRRRAVHRRYYVVCKQGEERIVIIEIARGSATRRSHNFCMIAWFPAFASSLQRETKMWLFPRGRRSGVTGGRAGYGVVDDNGDRMHV